MVIPPVISYDHFTPIFAYWFNLIAKLKYLVNQKAEEEIRAILDHLAAQDQALAQMHQVLVELQIQASQGPELRSSLSNK